MTPWRVAVAMLLCGVLVAAQGQPAFVVASVKLNTSGLPYDQSRDRVDGVDLVNERLRDVILFAFDLLDFQLVGAPQWVADERYDINVRGAGPLSPADKRDRLQRLLVDRFGLRVRSDMREQAVYALVRTGTMLGKGLKSRECGAQGIGATGIAGLPCGDGIAAADGGVVGMAGIPMTRLAAFLGGVLGRVVIDETGLNGPFDVELRYRPDIGLSPDLTPLAIERINSQPALPVALQEQLGLRLQSKRASVRQVKIESIAHPTSD
jgi:uncharacterized protein (TIGR03435 family)